MDSFSFRKKMKGIEQEAIQLRGSVVAMIKVIKEMFGEAFWKQCVLIVTWLPMRETEKVTYDYRCHGTEEGSESPTYLYQK